MPSQTDTDLDAALSQAQAAVNSLAEDVSSLQTPNVASMAATQTPAQDAVTVATLDAPPRRQVPPRASSSKLPQHLRRILNLRVPVIVRVAQRPILLSAVLKLVPGNILEFDRSVDSELDLLVNNHQIGTGAAVKVNEHFGLRINFIGEPRDRLRQITQQ
jgi:flagellar motor switch/type III secretory pathway protein FliN